MKESEYSLPVRVSGEVPVAGDTAIYGTFSTESAVSLEELFYMFLANMWKIILCALLGGCLAFAWTKFFVTPLYTATAKIYVVSASNDSVVDLSDLQIGSQLTSDYSAMLTLHPLLNEVIDNLQLNMSYEELADMISVRSPADTRLLYITVQHPQPALAADIANEIAELSTVFLPEIMECKAPNIAEEALVPTAPSSPSYSRNATLGAFAAAVFYCGFLLVRFLLNDTFRTPEDVERYLGEVPLCVIPEIAALSNDDKNKKAAHGFRSRHGRQMVK